MPKTPPPPASGRSSTPAFPAELRRGVIACALILALTLLAGCGAKGTGPGQLFRPYGPPVSTSETPGAFTGWLLPQNQELASWKEMAPAVRKSLQYAESKPRSGVAVNRKGLRVTWGELQDSLQLLHALLPRLDENPGLLLERFRWIKMPAGIKYTSYYEPQIRASRTKKPGFTQPIYAAPPDLASYRRRHGRYYSRSDIDGPRQVLAGRDLELAWADPVDVYFLQIQGSGRLYFDDRTTAYVNYDGQNGHRYRSSGSLIVESGYRLESGDIFEQRRWFKAHPDKMQEIFFRNPSYVFFKFTTRGSMGAIGHTLDEWLSLATDPSYLPLGGVIAYGVNVPDPEHGRAPLRGIGFAQDIGGAIRGNRIDLYSGASDRANYVASFLDARGPAWLLLKR